VIFYKLPLALEHFLCDARRFDLLEEVYRIIHEENPYETISDRSLIVGTASASPFDTALVPYLGSLTSKVAGELQLLEVWVIRGDEDAVMQNVKHLSKKTSMLRDFLFRFREICIEWKSVDIFKKVLSFCEGENILQEIEGFEADLVQAEIRNGNEKDVDSIVGLVSLGKKGEATSKIEQACSQKVIPYVVERQLYKVYEQQELFGISLDWLTELYTRLVKEGYQHYNSNYAPIYHSINTAYLSSGDERKSHATHVIEIIHESKGKVKTSLLQYAIPHLISLGLPELAEKAFMKYGKAKRSGVDAYAIAKSYAQINEKEKAMKVLSKVGDSVGRAKARIQFLQLLCIMENDNVST